MNQDNKKQVILAAVLGVVLVVVLVYQLLIAGGPTPPTPPASATATATAGGAATGANTTVASAAAPAGAPARLNKVDVDLDQLLRNIEAVNFEYSNERISRNPMTPLVGRIFSTPGAVEETGPILNEFSIRQKSVSGIIYSEFSPVAIIDDQVVTEGHEYADGVVVTRIEPKRVWFQWRDSLIPVELKEL